MILICCIFEQASGVSLHGQGIEWERLREGEIILSGRKLEFVELLKLMIHPNPQMRPSASEILKNTLLRPPHLKIVDNYRKSIREYQLQIHSLQQQLHNQSNKNVNVSENVNNTKQNQMETLLSGLVSESQNNRQITSIQTQMLNALMQQNQQILNLLQTQLQSK
jgi:serine/threonine protein kinase